jgi:hypothetical protein
MGKSAAASMFIDAIMVSTLKAITNTKTEIGNRLVCGKGQNLFVTSRGFTSNKLGSTEKFSLDIHQNTFFN